jgi:hypothetical protein
VGGGEVGGGEAGGGVGERGMFPDLSHIPPIM